MTTYTVTFSRSARKELESLPSPVVQRIYPKIEALEQNPRPHGVKKIEGEEKMYRIRVGDYRVIYEISDKMKSVDIAHIRHRSEAYRGLD
jgi:mRNA interferase RelE/StbE